MARQDLQKGTGKQLSGPLGTVEVGNWEEDPRLASGADLSRNLRHLSLQALARSSVSFLAMPSRPREGHTLPLRPSELLGLGPLTWWPLPGYAVWLRGPRVRLGRVGRQWGMGCAPAPSPGCLLRVGLCRHQ